MAQRRHDTMAGPSSRSTRADALISAAPADAALHLQQHAGQHEPVLRRALPTPAIPLYTGLTDPVEWLARFHRVGLASGWRPEDDAMVLPSFLDGMAAVWYDQQPEDVKTSSERLRDALVSTFGNANSSAAAREELYVRYQRPSESVTEYAIAVADLCRRADPRMSPADRVYFLRRGLKPELRNLIAAATTGDPTWDDVVTAARRIEAAGLSARLDVPVLKAETNAILPARSDNALQAILERLERLEQRLNDHHTHKKERYVKCDRCGKNGHTASVCRAPAPRHLGNSTPSERPMAYHSNRTANPQGAHRSNPPAERPAGHQHLN